MHKQRNNIRAAAVVVQFNLSSQTLGTMMEMLIIERLEKGYYRWVGSAPTYDMVSEILMNISKSIKKYSHNNKVKAVAKTEPKPEPANEPRKIDEQYCIDFLKKTGKYEIFVIEKRML
jgi:hypothetical protein